MSPGDNDVLHFGTIRQRLDHVLHRQPTVMHGVGELVQYNEVVFPGVDHFLGIFPQRPGQVCAGVQILRAPSKPVAHGPNRYAHLGRSPLLAEIGCGVLDKLQHHHLHVPTPRPHQHTHGGGGFTLAVARVNNYQSLVDARPTHRLGPVPKLFRCHFHSVLFRPVPVLSRARFVP